MSPKGRRPSRHSSESAPAPSDVEPVEPGLNPANGTSTEVAEEPAAVPQEEPAQVQLTIKGSDKSARAAAKRFGEGEAPRVPRVSTPSNDTEEDAPPDDADPVPKLLADGRNMVIVTRQTPRKIKNPRTGEKIVTNVRLPGKYTCPTSIQAIAEQVFDEYWGSTYKCTIHPDTSSGENTLLGHFQIEHPDPDAPPYIEGVTDVEEEAPPETRGATGTIDPTLSETDQLVKIRQDAERRMERARARKEAMEMEQLAKRMEEELENGTKPPQPSAESSEIQKLRERIAEQDRQLSEKKVNDRFDQLESTIGALAESVAKLATARPAASSEESVVMKMMTMSQQHSKDMMALLQEQRKPAANPEGDLDKFLDRVTKLQAVTGMGPNKGGGRSSEIEQRLLDFAYDHMLKGGESGDEGAAQSGDMYEDAIKLAIKEFAPVAKTFVEKKMAQETAANGGAPIPEETLKRIYNEAASAAASKVQGDLLSQGIQLVPDANGRLLALPAPKAGAKQVVTPRQPASRVVSTTKTAEGVVKKVAVEPHDLSKKPANPAPAPQVSAPTKGDDVPKCGVFPLIGPNGTELQIPFPVRPGEMKYDRKASVNFILDGIRSELAQGFPQKAQQNGKIECYVVGDCTDFLDDEILDQILDIDAGPALEALLAPWGDAAKIAEIKKAGEDEVVGSYLRRLVMAIQREWQISKVAPEK